VVVSTGVRMFIIVLYVISGSYVKRETSISIESSNQFHLVSMISAQEEMKGCSSLDGDNGKVLASKEVVCWNFNVLHGQGRN
jgi:hypothetical protein